MWHSTASKIKLNTETFLFMSMNDVLLINKIRKVVRYLNFTIVETFFVKIAKQEKNPPNRPATGLSTLVTLA